MSSTTNQESQEVLALQSKEHRGLLDTIDTLRSQGISRYVDLPQIIVCGDQSSGKSSVLEAISGMSFPTKDNLCTRFATELILRRSPEAKIKICIHPGPERTETEKAKLAAFTPTCNDMDMDMGEVVEDAKVAMGLTSEGQVFSTDILRVELSGPSQPHLTMVDLPGLFLAGNKDQSENDAKVVESLVLSYMSKPRSIILAVVSAKSDFALQQVTKHARALDPKGLRTLGLITKPDTLDAGSDSELFYVELAQNKDVKFCLGWHVLRNRSFATREASLAERDLHEAEFFSQGIWTSLDPSQLGVKALRSRLSNVLRDQILTCLPEVMNEVETGINECQGQLQKLGDSRSTASQQRRYLLKASEVITRLLKAAVDGFYTEAFFCDHQASSWKERRLRAVVQNALAEFAQEIEQDGQAIVVVEDEDLDSFNPDHISRSDYMVKVEDIMKESRGRELPGTYNPLIVAELFSSQCRLWSGLVDELADDILQSVNTTIVSVVEYSVDEATASKLLQSLIYPSMEKLKQRLMAKIEEILEPHIAGHPITYNHYLTENVQKAQSKRNKVQLEEKLKSFFHRSSIVSGVANYNFDMRELLNQLTSHTEPNMNRYSCSMAIDTTAGYYKVNESYRPSRDTNDIQVALKRFIDDISVLAVEKCLIQQLPSLFSPEVVWELTDTEVHGIAGESNESANKRKRASEKLSVLENGMEELKRLRRGVPSVVRTFVNSPFPLTSKVG